MTLLVKVELGYTVLTVFLMKYSDKYEAFIIMDADNLVSQSYLRLWIRHLMRDILSAPVTETQKILILAG